MSLSLARQSTSLDDCRKIGYEVARVQPVNISALLPSVATDALSWVALNESYIEFTMLPYTFVEMTFNFSQLPSYLYDAGGPVR
jgi:hypothetical protein